MAANYPMPGIVCNCLADRVGGSQVPELAVDLGDAVLQGPTLLPHAAEHAP